MSPETVEQTTIMLKIYQWVFPILITILAFIGGLGVKALIGISKTLNDIKIELAVGTEKHNALEEKHHALDGRVNKLEQKKR